MSARGFSALFGAAGLSVVLGAAIAANAQTLGGSAADNLPIPLYNKSTDSPVRPAVSERADNRSATAAPAPAKRRPETIAKYVGATVINDAGKKIGQIEDFVTETDSDGSITYAVVAIGKPLALDAKKVTIPVARLRLKGERLKLVSAGAHEQLNSWPDYEPSQYRSVARDAAVDDQAAPMPPTQTRPDRADLAER
jgi:hypothetical protein